MIDMHSGDKTCILSMLEFLSNLAIKHHVSPIITFDQPLYWKATEIIIDAPQNSPLKEIVLLLGCFHTFMNLLGAIGALKQGTGLSKILEAAYGKHTVVHIMTGKSVQRSFSGHLLVDKCINMRVPSSHHQWISPRICTLSFWQVIRLWRVLSHLIQWPQSNKKLINGRLNFQLGQRPVNCG